MFRRVGQRNQVVHQSCNNTGSGDAVFLCIPVCIGIWAVFHVADDTHYTFECVVYNRVWLMLYLICAFRQ